MLKRRLYQVALIGFILVFVMLGCSLGGIVYLRENDRRRCGGQVSWTSGNPFPRCSYIDP
jgi:hypothetical protein